MSDTDVLIIGGGIAGVSTAYYLSQYGCDVTLLESGDATIDQLEKGHFGGRHRSSRNVPSLWELSENRLINGNVQGFHRSPAPSSSPEIR